jgi:hypothetical protein
MSVEIPIFVAALAFFALAAVDWKRLPLSGRVCLGVATAFAVAALRDPGLSVQEFVELPHDGLAYVVAVARVAGLTAVLVSVALFLRNAYGRI